MYELSGSEREELQKAIIDAYPDIVDLAMVVSFKLNKNLTAIAGGNNNAQIIFKLILWAEANGCIEKLIDGLYNDRRKNSKISIIFNKIKPKYYYQNYPYYPIENPEKPQDTPEDLTQPPNQEKYKKFKNLLETNKWLEANQETLTIINKIHGIHGINQRYSWKASDIQECDCYVLCHIDQLWRQYSNNCFGFTVQKKIWEEKCTTKNDREKEFGRHVGWYDDWRKEWLSRSNQIFTENLEKNLDNKEKYQGILPILTSKNCLLNVNASLIPHLVNKLKFCNCDSCDCINRIYNT